MNIRLFTAALFGVCACWIASTHAASASDVLYDGTGFLQGTQSFVQSYDLAGPGQLTVTLSNVAWPEQLANLNLLLTSANGALAPEMGAGTAVFDIKNGGDVFAQWFGTAQGPLNVGVFGLKIQFQPTAGSGTPVPLPTSIALLLSGFALLVWQRRERDGGEKPAAGTAVT